jgi:hypothetical protein
VVKHACDWRKLTASAIPKPKNEDQIMTTNNHNATVVISLGRDVHDRPMIADHWSDFRATCRDILDDYGANIVFYSPASNNDQYSGFGTWDGAINEEACTFIALVNADCVPYIHQALALLASDFGQDAIGFIVADGVKNFVKADPAA